MLSEHKFCIFNNVTFDIIDDNDNEESMLDDDIVFYIKQSFIVYTRQETWEKIKEMNDSIYILALQESECELLSNGEYVTDLSNDKFICIIDDIEYDAHIYLHKRNINYEISDGGTTDMGFWVLT